MMIVSDRRSMVIGAARISQKEFGSSGFTVGKNQWFSFIHRCDFTVIYGLFVDRA